MTDKERTVGQAALERLANYQPHTTSLGALNKRLEEAGIDGNLDNRLIRFLLELKVIEYTPATYGPQGHHQVPELVRITRLGVKVQEMTLAKYLDLQDERERLEMAANAAIVEQAQTIKEQTSLAQKAAADAKQDARTARITMLITIVISALAVVIQYFQYRAESRPIKAPAPSDTLPRPGVSRVRARNSPSAVFTSWSADARSMHSVPTAIVKGNRQSRAPVVAIPLHGLQPSASKTARVTRNVARQFLHLAR